MLARYRPSHRVDPKFFLAMLLALVVAGLGGAVYGLIQGWIPLIIVDLVITALAGIVVGGLLMAAVTGGRCRSPMLAILAGLVLSAGALLAAHFVRYLMTRGDLAAELQTMGRSEEEIALFHEAFTFSEYINYKVETGWSIGKVGRDSDAPLNGWFVYAVWLAELGIVWFVAGGMGAGSARQPSIEVVGQWADKQVELASFYGASPEAKHAIARATAVDELVPTFDNSGLPTSMIKYTLAVAAADPTQGFLTITHASEEVDDKGNAKTVTTDLQKNVVLEPEGIQSVNALLMAQRPTPADEAVAG